MPAPQDDDVSRLRIALARISRTIDRQVAGDGDGLTRTQMSVLGTVGRNRAIGAGELADIEGMNPTMLSRVIGKLEDLGYLRRVTSNEDRRAVVVEITPDGTRMHDQLRAERTALLAAHLDTLPGGERDALLSAVPALELLGEAMRAGQSERVRATRGRLRTPTPRWPPDDVDGGTSPTDLLLAGQPELP